VTLPATLLLSLLGAAAAPGPSRPAEAAVPAATAAPTPAATSTPVAAEAPAAAQPQTDAERSLRRTEEAFAASFAARDPAKFASFLGDEPVFAGRKRLLRGKQAIVEAWTSMMMSGPAAPFSWRPTRVIVSGDAGMSSGAVFDPDGKWIGSFTSVWRRQPDGTWRIVLDGTPPCSAAE
jgi:ketosteroid isomerase-like protein